MIIVVGQEGNFNQFTHPPCNSKKYDGGQFKKPQSNNHNPPILNNNMTLEATLFENRRLWRESLTAQETDTYLRLIAASSGFRFSRVFEKSELKELLDSKSLVDSNRLETLNLSENADEACHHEIGCLWKLRHTFGTLYRDLTNGRVTEPAGADILHVLCNVDLAHMAGATSDQENKDSLSETEPEIAKLYRCADGSWNKPLIFTEIGDYYLAYGRKNAFQYFGMNLTKEYPFSFVYDRLRDWVISYFALQLRYFQVSLLVGVVDVDEDEWQEESTSDAFDMIAKRLTKQQLADCMTWFNKRVKTYFDQLDPRPEIENDVKCARWWMGVNDDDFLGCDDLDSRHACWQTLARDALCDIQQHQKVATKHLKRKHDDDQKFEESTATSHKKQKIEK